MTDPFFALQLAVDDRHFFLAHPILTTMEAEHLSESVVSDVDFQHLLMNQEAGDDSLLVTANNDDDVSDEPVRAKCDFSERVFVQHHGVNGSTDGSSNPSNALVRERHAWIQRGYPQPTSTSSPSSSPTNVSHSSDEENNHQVLNSGGSDFRGTLQKWKQVEQRAPHPSVPSGAPRPSMDPDQILAAANVSHDDSDVELLTDPVQLQSPDSTGVESLLQLAVEDATATDTSGNTVDRSSSRHDSTREESGASGEEDGVEAVVATASTEPKPKFNTFDPSTHVEPEAPPPCEHEIAEALLSLYDDLADVSAADDSYDALFETVHGPATYMSNSLLVLDQDDDEEDDEEEDDEDKEGAAGMLQYMPYTASTAKAPVDAPGELLLEDSYCLDVTDTTAVEDEVFQESMQLLDRTRSPTAPPVRSAPTAAEAVSPEAATCLETCVIL